MCNIWRKWNLICIGPISSLYLVLGYSNKGQYLQHMIFFVTYKKAKHVWVLHYTMLERFTRNKCSNLLGPYERYGENKMLSIWHYAMLERLTRTKCSYLVGPFVLQWKWNVVSKAPRSNLKLGLGYRNKVRMIQIKLLPKSASMRWQFYKNFFSYIVFTNKLEC